MSEQKSLVTGAAGFIGSHLVDRLLSMGHTVVGVDNMVLGRRENLADAFKSPRFTFRELDVNDYPAFESYVREQSAAASFTTVWHMAANSDIQAGGRDPEVDLKLTFLTTFNTLKAMKALRIPQIAFASTSAIYGDHPGVLHEDLGPLFPISNYGAMKLASEGAISAALEAYLSRAWIFRFPNVVGSRATHGAIFDFLKKLGRNPRELEVLGDGSQEKPYLHVTELICAMIHIFTHAAAKLNYFNIAPTNTATTVREMAEMTVRIAAPGAKIRYTGGNKGWVGDVPKFTYSTQKVQALGWTPRMTSNEAIEQTIRENLHLVRA